MKIDAIVKSKKRRPKKRKKDAEEDVLDRFADEEVSQLREEMLRAAQEDDEANREKLPATSKLKLLPRVKEVLQKYVLFDYDIKNQPLKPILLLIEEHLHSPSWTITYLKVSDGGLNPSRTGLSPLSTSRWSSSSNFQRCTLTQTL